MGYFHLIGNAIDRHSDYDFQLYLLRFPIFLTLPGCLPTGESILNVLKASLHIYSLIGVEIF